MLENCSIVKNINCVYPTLTYPCHTSMVTGSIS
ncbi:alkaline phosphatase family protein [Clostridioides difficile]|nr:alkaline phosphatase family protein [Clostridioides difficile]